MDGTSGELCEICVHPVGPEEGSWVPGYYSILFEDPDGIRLELNHVPGKGNLTEGIALPLRERASGGTPDQT